MKTNVCIVLFIFIINSSYSANVDKEHIAIFDFEYYGITKDNAIIISELFRSEVVNINYFVAVERDKLNKVFEEQALQQSGCTSNECIINVGKLIGVDKVVLGRITGTGDNVFISVRKLDIESGKIDLSINENLSLSKDNIRMFINRMAIKLAPPEYWCNQAQSASHSLKLQYLKNALSSDSTYALAYNLLGNYYSTQALLVGFGSPDLKNDKTSMGEYVNISIKLHEQAIKYGNDPKCYFDLGQIYENYKNDNYLSNYYYNMAIKMDTLYSAAYYHRGMLYKKSERINEALLDLTKAIILDTCNVDYLLERSEIYSDIKKYPDAINDLNIAIKKYPNNQKCIYQRANVYREMESYDNAITDYTTAINLAINDLNRKDTDLMFYYTFRAIAYKRVGNYNGALLDLGKAININPNDCNLYEYRADLYNETGNTKAALNDYKNCLSCCKREQCSDENIAEIINKLR